mgnify:FL=1
MQICDVVTGTKRLQRATKSLKEQWHWTKDYWRDRTADEFEEKYLQPLAEQLRMAFSAIDEIAEVLDQAEKDLGDHDQEHK